VSGLKEFPKKGDKVRYIESKYPFLTFGKEYEVTEADDDSFLYVDDEGTELSCNAFGYKVFELVTKGSDNLTKFNYVSLFSGIGGFETALDKLGGNCVIASEIDKFAKQSYTAIHGDERLFGDITKLDEVNFPNHDLLVGGFPCQAFSVAGNRKGFEDVRGTLFFEIVRIAKEKQPKVLLLENVKGLVNHDKGRTLNVMIETLCEIGYTVDFTILNSKYFGVPQNRERIFIVAVRDDLITPEPWVINGSTIIPRGKERIQALEGIKTFNFDFPQEGEVVTRLRDVLETEADEKYYLSEDKTAALVEQLDGRENDDNPTLIDVSQAKREGKPRLYQDVASTVTARIYKDPYMIGRAEPQVIANGEALSYCLDANYTKGIAPSGINKGRRTHIEEVRPVLTPEREEKRQNGRRFKENDEPAFTINTQDRHGVAIGQIPRYRIRKLTPLECWRLQGFSDEAHQKAVDAGLSDSQRYKQAGNAVTVNVIQAIGERIIPYLSE